MDERILKWLQDIKVSCNEIESFFKNIAEFDTYKKDILIKRATERNLEIIGEAVNRIYKRDPDFNISNAKSIIGLRNFIIHAYDNITDETIWSIVINHLPKLKSEVELFLKEQNET